MTASQRDFSPYMRDAPEDGLGPAAGRAVVRGLGGAIAAAVAGTSALLVVGAVRARRRRAMHLSRLVEALAERDPSTAWHSRRVAAMAEVIARAMRLTRATIERVRLAALLHDVGKVDARYAPLLAKAGPLTPDEWAVMRTHAAVGASIVARETRVRDVLALRGVADAVRHHHERWDGTGYPDRLRGIDIPLEARIIAVADTIDAITSDRPYQRGGGEETALAILRAGRGTHLDPRLCDRVLAPELWGAVWHTAHDVHFEDAMVDSGAHAGIAVDDAAGVRSLVEDIREEYERRLRLGLPLGLNSLLAAGDDTHGPADVGPVRAGSEVARQRSGDSRAGRSVPDAGPADR